MNAALRILVAYGVIVISYGLVLGIAMARARSSNPQAPRHLVTTHLSALMQGPVVLSLGFATTATGFDGGVAAVAGSILVAGLALEIVGGTVNWLARTGDQFAERSIGFRINAVSGPLTLAGGVWLTVGVLVNL